MTEGNATRRRAAALREAIERIQRGRGPTDEELATAPLLECWHLTEHHSQRALGGYVSGHPSLPENVHILTSTLVWVSEDKRAARTVSRYYRLGSSLEEVLAKKKSF